MDEALAHWGNFYSLMGESAATLIGLMFIALTFGSKLVTEETTPLTRAFLSPIIYHFAQAFVISSVALIPGAGHHVLGMTSILLALLRISDLPRVRKGLNLATNKEDHDVERSDWIFGIYLPSFFYSMFLLFGVAILMDQSWSLTGLGFSVIGILILGVATAWDTLIWIASKLD